MEISITSKEKHPLLHRTDIKASVRFEGPTPNRKELRKEITKVLNAKDELLVLKHIKSQFGNHIAILTLALYDDVKTLEQLEHKRVIEKHASPKKADKEAEKPAEAEA
ncbi:MAG: hypothetical protein ABIA93_04725 [Candidatus Woesearchaeota archaeon]